MKFSSRQHLEFASREAARGSTVYCGGGRALTRVLGDIKMYVRADDVTMAPHLMQDGFWEAWITLFVQNFVKPGHHVVNVGSAFGYYALYAASLGARVTAFEPQAELAELTRWSVALNGLDDRCRVVGAACGAEATRRRLYVDKIRVGGATLQDRGSSYTALEPARDSVVQVTTLDQHFDARSSSAERVDLLLVDTEGHEPEVLAGGRQLLERNDRAVVVLEVTPAWWRDAAGVLRDLETRYAFRDIDGEGRLVDISREKVLAAQQLTIALVPRL